MAKTLKDKGEERKKLSERINGLINSNLSVILQHDHTECQDLRVNPEGVCVGGSLVRFPGIDWRFMTAQQMRKCVKLLEEP